MLQVELCALDSGDGKELPADEAEAETLERETKLQRGAIGCVTKVAKRSIGAVGLQTVVGWGKSAPVRPRC